MKVTVLPGLDKDGKWEQFDRLDFNPGDTVSIVGNTGSGKSTLINDIEVLAHGDTVSGRNILIDGQVPSDDMVRNPANKPISLITQNTRVLADLPVSRFLDLHIMARNVDKDLMKKTISLANEFTGESISECAKISSLSGGQTKALLIADAMVIGQAPILLLDEVENAGIYKERFIKNLKEYNKTVIFVTHNPLLSLITDRRIVMKNGSIVKVLEPNGAEHEAIDKLKEIDSYLMSCRELIRKGEMM
jgi:ABC-type lipoprotein export system ATPase subunit